MGATVYIKRKDGQEFYFRDSYNAANLSWAKRLCYIDDFPKDPQGFMRKLSKTTDEEIDMFLDRYIREMEVEESVRDGAKKALQSKRKYLQEILVGDFEADVCT